MPRFSYITHHNFRIFPKELRWLFVSKIFHSLGLQLSIFFLPIFLFQQGEKTTLNILDDLTSFQKGMFYIGIFFLLQRLLITFLSVPMGKVIAKIGAKKAMIIGQLLNIVIMLLFSVVEIQPGLLVPIVLLESFKIPLFWCAFYVMFASSARLKHMGQNVGTIEFFTRLMHALVPALSGFIIVYFGFMELFLTAFVCHVFSIMTLMLADHNPKSLAPSWREMKRWWGERQFRLLGMSFVGRYFHDTLQFLWPFFVFILIGNIEKVGFLYSLIFFMSLLIIYFTGWYVDHQKSRRPLQFSGITISITWLLRMVVSSLWGIIAIDTVEKLAMSIFQPFYDAIMIRRGKGSHVLPYFIYREIIISVSGIIFWSVFLVYFFVFVTWQSFLLLGFIGALLSMLARDRELEE